MFGSRITAVFVVIAATFLQDCLALYLEGCYHGDHSPLRMYGTMFLYSLYFTAAATSANVRMVLLHVAQNDLTQEKESFDDLFTMMCDCKILLAADGKTVIRSDARFTTFLGKHGHDGGFTVSIQLRSLPARLASARHGSHHAARRARLSDGRLVPGGSETGGPEDPRQRARGWIFGGGSNDVSTRRVLVHCQAKGQMSPPLLRCRLLCSLK